MWWAIISTLLLFLFPIAHGADIVCFGDSWGAGACDNLEQVVKRRHPERNFINSAVGGTTAAYWAANSQVLPSVVNLQPECLGPAGECWVWLSIGGNDFLGEMAAGIPVEEIASRAVNNTAIMLNALFEANNNTRVVMFGYDILNFEMSSYCRAYHLAIFGAEPPLTIAQTNNLFYQIQRWLQFDLLPMFPLKLTIVDLFGSAQADAGIDNAPDFTKYTPLSHMGNSNDCIHYNDRGYDAVMRNMYDLYWVNEL